MDKPELDELAREVQTVQNEDPSRRIGHYWKVIEEARTHLKTH